MAFDLKTAIADHNTFFCGRETITHRPMAPRGLDCETAIGVKTAATKARLTAFGSLTTEDVDTIWEVYETTQAVNNGDLLLQADGTKHLVMGRFYSDLTSRYNCATKMVA